MKRIIVLVALATISLVSAAQEADVVVAAATSSAIPRQADVSVSVSVDEKTLPPVSLGDTCEYEVRDLHRRWVEKEQVVRIDRSGYETEFLIDGQRKGTRKYLMNGNWQKAAFFQYPMIAGKEWNVRFSSKTSAPGGLGTMDVQFVGRVNRIFQRSVVSGSQSVLTVVEFTFTGGTTEYYPGEGVFGGVVKQVFQYAPSIRCIVQSETKFSNVVGHGVITKTLKLYRNLLVNEYQ